MPWWSPENHADRRPLLLQRGAIDAQIAKRFALRDAGAALRYAEQGALVGKVVLEP